MLYITILYTPVQITFPPEIVDMCQQQVLDDEEKSLANDLDGPDISSDTIPKKSKADKAKKGELHIIPSIVRLLNAL